MRYSKQRELILEIVRNSHTHPNAEWVYEQAKKQMPAIGIATVYRNLNRLADSGLIARISSDRGTERYDGRTERHYHMMCRRCGGLFDLTVKMPEFQNRIEQLADVFFIEASEIEVSTALLEGVCRQCTAADNGGEL